MRAPLNNDTLIENNDLIAVADRGEPVGNHDAGYSSFADSLYHIIFRPGIERTRRLIQNDDGRILCQHPGDLQSLSLTAGEVFAVLCQLALISAGSGQYIIVDLGISRSQDHFEILDRIIPHPDVGVDGIFKQDDILIHDRYGTGKNTSVNI